LPINYLVLLNEVSRLPNTRVRRTNHESIIS
jgi:hypothetical protein